METRIASTSSHLSSHCIFLSVARPKGQDRARIHFERPSDTEGENKNNVLAEAKQSIFNSRPRRKIHELLSMATSRFCHVCCLHSLLLPFLFPLSHPSAPTVFAWVLPARLSVGPGICRQLLCHPGVCTSLMSPPCSSACHAWPVHVGFRFSILGGAAWDQASFLFSKLSTALALVPPQIIEATYLPYPPCTVFGRGRL